MIEFRLAEGNAARLPTIAAELISLEVDVIVAPGNLAALAAKHATSTLPIVFAAASDPVTVQEQGTPGHRDRCDGDGAPPWRAPHVDLRPRRPEPRRPTARSDEVWKAA